MPMIFETLVCTESRAGRVHLAPMGARYEGERVLLMPFRPSTTLDNILATRRAVLNLSTEVRVFAGCVTGRRDWPLVALEGGGQRLQACLAHAVLDLEAVREDAERPELIMRRGKEGVHGPFPGFNRAQAAVIEGAVLVSRLHMLPPDKIDAEFAYLQIAIDRTAGPAELEAWGWLLAAVARFRASSAATAAP